MSGELEPGGRFFIHSRHHQQGPHAVWWGPGQCGYVADLAHAGRYSWEEAREIVSRPGARNQAFPVEEVLARARLIVEPERLRELSAMPEGVPSC